MWVVRLINFKEYVMNVISPINDIGTKNGRVLELKRLNIKRLNLVRWYNERYG